MTSRGWGSAGRATTLLLLRHGDTSHTRDKRFSGGLASSNPGLTQEGRDQMRAAARWLESRGGDIDALVASPVRRTAESAAIVSGVLGLPVVEEPGFAEMEFGDWDGLTFAEVGERSPDELERWLGSVDVAPPGGESFEALERRVVAGLDRILTAHEGQTVVVVTHVTPIKTVVARAVAAPLSSLFRMELSSASLSVVSFHADGRASLRLFNGRPGVAPWLAVRPR